MCQYIKIGSSKEFKDMLQLTWHIQSSFCPGMPVCMGDFEPHIVVFNSLPNVFCEFSFVSKFGPYIASLLVLHSSEFLHASLSLVP